QSSSSSTSPSSIGSASSDHSAAGSAIGLPPSRLAIPGGISPRIHPKEPAIDRQTPKQPLPRAGSPPPPPVGVRSLPGTTGVSIAVENEGRAAPTQFPVLTPKLPPPLVLPTCQD